MMEPFVTAASLLIVPSYVAEKIWQHRRHWYQVPDGLRIPKVEVACIASALGSLFASAFILAL